MIELTNNMRLVNEILMNPLIWQDIAPKGVDPSELFSVAIPGALYFMVNQGDGVIIYHPFRDGMKIHPNFLLEKRGGLAYKAIEQSIQKIFSFGYQNIYAEIEVRLRHVRFTAVGLQFQLIEKGDRYLYQRLAA